MRGQRRRRFFRRLVSAILIWVATGGLWLFTPSHAQQIQNFAELYDDQGGGYPLWAFPLVRVAGGPPSSGALYDITLGGTRTDAPSWVTDGTFEWPIAPTTSVSETVSTIGELQAAVAIDGNQITISAGSYVGNVTITGTDVDVICSNSATITGTVSWGNGGVRQRWTGGNVNGYLDINGASGRAYDIIWDNINCTFDSSAGDNDLSSRFSRVAILNCTITGTGSNGSGGWCLYCGYTNLPTDLIIANTKLDHAGGSQTLRLQGVTRYILIDGSHNASGNGVNAFRGLANDYVWISDMVMYGAWLIGDGTGAHLNMTLRNLTLKRLAGYGNTAAFFTDGGTSTGTWDDSNRYNTDGTNGAASVSPFTGSNNNNVAWTESFPVQDVSGIGADH